METREQAKIKALPLQRTDHKSFSLMKYVGMSLELTPDLSNNNKKINKGLPLRLNKS